jgi:uncharacterized protein YjbI with pentapeptide repeats
MEPPASGKAGGPMRGLRQSIIAGAADGTLLRPETEMIEEPLQLDAAQLGHLDFRGVVFDSRTSFRNTVWTGLAWFDGATFRGDADFSGARFDNDARFDKVTFEGDVSFAGCEFRGVADFDDAQFQKRASFDGATCCANLLLEATRFHDEASFRGAELHGGLWCRGTVFTSLDVDRMLVMGRVFPADAAARFIAEPAARFPRPLGGS